MDFSDDVFKDVFGGLYEPFAGLNEMDFELHGIYMDHEPQNEFFSPLNKCKDSFLNVLLSDDSLRNSSIVDEVRAQVYHDGDWKSDEEVVQERDKVKKKHIIHDPNTRWDLMEPKLGDMFESMAQLKFCMQNYAVANIYGLYYEKCDNTRKFKFGAMVTPEWIDRHYITETANKPKFKLREIIVDIKQTYKCVVSIGQVRRARA
ncbi:unnamed protein product [Lactuca virosa]|uniref:Uncharacterized protein n=1 Tax=Lactuca virosa TaxID=75947 RepID=A0AAU9MYQ6_9ASTR|nr:unnamed protein product [Lactuca virosa]